MELAQADGAQAQQRRTSTADRLSECKNIRKTGPSRRRRLRPASPARGVRQGGDREISPHAVRHSGPATDTGTASSPLEGAGHSANDRVQSPLKLEKGPRSNGLRTSQPRGVED